MTYTDHIKNEGYPMNVQLLFTVTGAYHGDLVKELSQKTHALNGKWLTSKINHIDKYMAGLIKIEINEDNAKTLIAAFHSMPIQVHYVELKHLKNEKPNRLDLTIDAKDRPGLVSDISNVLNEHSIKIDTMECNRIGVVGLSDLVFTSQFQICVSDSFEQASLIEALQEISSDFVINLNAQAA
jgi:glycine cleavage system regulatory protein